MAHDPTRDPLLRQRLLFRVGDDSDVDVRVEVLVVGIAVMPVVLVHPPAVAHAEQPVAGHDPDHGVDATAGKHLSVPRVVELEAELAGHESQERGQEDRGPDTVHEGQQPQARGEGKGVRRQHQGVVARTLAQEPSGFDPPLELRVRLRRPR